MADIEYSIALDTTAINREIGKLVDKIETEFEQIKPKIDVDGSIALREIKKVGNEYDKLTKGASLSTNELKKALAQMTLAGQQGTKEFAQMKTQLEKSVAESKQLAKAMQAVENSIEEATKDARKLDNELDQASQSTGKIGGAFGSMGQALKGAAIAAGTAALAAGLQQVIDKGLEFETSLAEFSQITGVSGDALKDFGLKARDLAKEFGGDAASQIESFKGILSRLGPDIAKSPEALERMAKAVNTLSLASGLDATASMDALTNSMLQFNVNLDDPIKAADEMTKMMNVMAAGAKEGAAEVPQVSEAIVAAGVAASGAKLSFEEVNAAIQSLATGGKYGSEAGTALRNVIGLLQKQSGEGEKALAKLGLSTEKLGQTLTTQGLGAALTQLRDGMKGLATDSERNVLLMTLFGQENSAAAGIMLKNVDAMGQMQDKITGTNTAFEQAAIKQETTEQKLAKFQAKLGDVAITIAGTVLPVFNALIDNIEPIAAILGAATIAVGTYMAITNAATIATTIASTATAIWNAILLANPIGLIVAGVALLVAGIIYFTRETKVMQVILKAVGDAFMVVWEVIKWVGIALYDYIAWVIKAYMVMGELIIKSKPVQAVFNAIADAAKWVWEQIKKFWEFNVLLVKSFIEFVKNSSFIQGAIKGIGAAFDAVVGVIKDVVGWIVKAIDFVANFGNEEEKATPKIQKKTESVKESAKATKDATDKTKDNTDKTKDNTDKTDDNTKSKKEQKTVLEKLKEELEKVTASMQNMTIGSKEWDEAVIRAKRIQGSIADIALKTEDVNRAIKGLKPAIIQLSDDINAEIQNLSLDAIPVQLEIDTKGTWGKLEEETASAGETVRKNFKIDQDILNGTTFWDNAGKQATAAMEEISASSINAFGEIIASGDATFEELGKASLKSIAQTASKTLDMYIPNILAAAWSISPFLAPLALAAIVGLKALMSKATAAAGAEEGVVGIDGNYNRPRGATDTIPLWVAPGETIFSQKDTMKNLALFKHIKQYGTADGFIMTTNVSEDGSLVSELRETREVFRRELRQARRIDMYDRTNIRITDERTYTKKDWGGR